MTEKGGLLPPHIQHLINYHRHTKTNKQKPERWFYSKGQNQSPETETQAIWTLSIRQCLFLMFVFAQTAKEKHKDQKGDQKHFK